MEMITNPINTIAKIQGMNSVDVKRYEKMCQKALKTAKNDVCVVKTKNGEKYITTDALCQILDSLDYRYNVLNQNWDKIHGIFENETKPIKNVNEKLPKKSPNTIDKPKKINYINKTKTTKTGDKTMKKYMRFDPKFTAEKLSKMDLNQINEQKTAFENKLKTAKFPELGKNGFWAKREFFESVVAAMDAEIRKRTYTPNVNEKLPKKSPKTVDNTKKNCYIKTTNETKTTKTGDKTMINKKEIAKIAPNAVKNILAAQKTNKTDTKKTYWGGWAKVHAGMNAAYNDYEKYQNFETEWLELRQKLGGTKSPLYHFCWKLINNNRVGVKQEPNSTLRFIKNVKIRIAMANDVLANKNKYENEIAENWKKTFGTEI